MPKDADVNLTCRQCGRQFVFTKAEQDFYKLKGFTSPSRCQACRSAKQNHSHHLVCSQCGTELEKGSAIYCSACLASVQLEFELKSKQSQKVASEAHTKLLVSESQKAELAESLRQKERLITELKTKVNDLSQDLDKAYQFRSGLQPALNNIEKRLEALEQAHNKINERMLQLAERVHEMYENTGLLEIIKRSLGQYRSQGA